MCKEVKTRSARMLQEERHSAIVCKCHVGKASVYVVQCGGGRGHNSAWNPILSPQKVFPMIVCHRQGKQGLLGTLHIGGEVVWHMYHHQ